MKAANVFYLALGLFIIPFLVSIFALTPQQAQAQDSGYLEPFEKYNREELAQMLAPIALYPDALLSQILMASTYPIEVIEADRWARENLELKGESLNAALLNKHWDPSVKAICHFPSTLALMSERITETTNLGNAFLAQETEVMGMIQELRAGAYAHGNLNTTSEQKVIVEKETIIIEPADPRTIYVPYYDPYFIYGPWWWSPAYPPYYWGPPGISIGVGISYWPGIYFAFTFSGWSYFDWHHHYIYIDVHKRPRFVRHDRWIAKPGRWLHAPSHRRGVAYRDKFTARKYGQSPHRSTGFRWSTRGFPEHRDSDVLRTWIDQDRQRADRTKIDRYRQEQERADRYKQERQRINLDKKKPERKEPETLKRERVERDRKKQIKIVPDRRKRERVEHEKQWGSRDNVFNRVEDGRKERQSSERGRFSRQILEGDDKGDRNDRLRKWR